jgi:hypothetical protein
MHQWRSVWHDAGTAEIRLMATDGAVVIRKKKSPSGAHELSFQESRQPTVP